MFWIAVVGEDSPTVGYCGSGPSFTSAWLCHCHFLLCGVWIRQLMEQAGATKPPAFLGVLELPCMLPPFQLNWPLINWHKLTLILSYSVNLWYRGCEILHQLVDGQNPLILPLFKVFHRNPNGYPGNLTVCYRKLPFSSLIYPLKMVIFHSFLYVYQRVLCLQDGLSIHSLSSQAEVRQARMELMQDCRRFFFPEMNSMHFKKETEVVGFLWISMDFYGFTGHHVLRSGSLPQNTLWWLQFPHGWVKTLGSGWYLNFILNSIYFNINYFSYIFNMNHITIQFNNIDVNI